MVDNSNDIYADPGGIKLPEYDVIVEGDAPRPRFPVGKTWCVISRGIDGRYREVVADRQDDFEHALRLVEAYTTPGEDMPGFIPDATVIRDGSAIHLLRALEAVVEWADASGSTGDIIDDARAAIRMAADPLVDVADYSPDQLTLGDIREAGEAGAWAYREGTPRSANPHPQTSPLYLHWDRGWELGSIAIEDEAGA